MTLLVLTLLPACGESTKRTGKSPRATFSSDGLIEYLKSTPAIKTISQWQNPYAPGVTITTAHYQIHTTLLDPLILRQLPAFMEAVYREYNRQLPSPIGTRTLFRTYLFADRQQWESFTKTFTGPAAKQYLAIKKGAYYLNGACVAYNIGRTRTFGILGHEGWHQFNSKHFIYRLPSWLDEGIATLFESYHYENGAFTFMPDRNVGRLGALKQTIASGSMMSIGELITLNPGQIVHGEPGAMAGFYSQSYGLVRFLREEGYGVRIKKYHALLLDALNGKWPINAKLSRIASDRNIRLTVRWNTFISPKLFSHYLNEDMDNLEKEYKAFCNKIVYHVRIK
jgi:hypothetical protein